MPTDGPKQRWPPIAKLAKAIMNTIKKWYTSVTDRLYATTRTAMRGWPSKALNQFEDKTKVYQKNDRWQRVLMSRRNRSLSMKSAHLFLCSASEAALTFAPASDDLARFDASRSVR